MFLLDTNVVSELRKVQSGKADREVRKWAEGVDASSLFISVITLQELDIGVLLAERRDARKGALLRSWLQVCVRSAFRDRILMIDGNVAVCSAKLHVPDPKPFRDGLIAATALVHGMTLVTRNSCDFERTGVILLNPWKKLST